MEKNDVKNKVVDLLRSRRNISLEAILEEFEKEDRGKVTETLESDLKKILVFDEKTGYRFRHRFGPRPKPVHPGKPRFSEMKVIAPAAYPDIYTNPDTSNLVPLDQDAIGDCVGCSGANFSKLMRFRILKIPTPAFTMQRDVVNTDGITVDILPDDTVSAAGVYCMARAREIPPPANTDDGAQISNAADAITQVGLVPEWMWPTGKTSDQEFYFAPPAAYATLESQQVGLYKFGGSWSVLDGVSGDPTTQIQAAVTTYGGCWMAMPVFDNYGDASPSGDFPDPTSSSTIVGYHAICIVGWTRATGNRRWQFVNSWYGNTPLINTISDTGYMQPYFKAGDIQLISVMPGSAVAFIARTQPNPLPGPGPAPVQKPTITGVSPNSGTTSGGTTVIITGTGFAGVTAVQFGSTPAGIYSDISSTSVSAVTPLSQAGTVNVSIVAPTGTAVDVNGYLYTTPEPTPNIGFWEALIADIVAFFESIFGKKAGRKPVSS